MKELIDTWTGYSPAHKPATPYATIHAIAENLPKMWKKHHKKLIKVKAAKIKKLPKNHRGEYKDSEKLIFNGHKKKVDNELPDIDEVIE